MSTDNQEIALLEHTAVIVLAAGRSVRLGSPKQLLCFDGRTLLARTLHEVERLRAARAWVVVGPACAEVCSEVARFDFAQLVENPAPERGLSSSLQIGLQAARESDPALAAVLVTLCDQPYLSSELLRDLVRALVRGKSIAASAYDGVLGVPAAFTSSVFAELESLEGDRGARDVLRRDPARVAAVAFAAGVVDIDRPEDLA